MVSCQIIEVTKELPRLLLQEIPLNIRCNGYERFVDIVVKTIHSYLSRFLSYNYT